MRKAAHICAYMCMLAVAPAWADNAIRFDIAALGATDGPSAGFAIGADVALAEYWAWTLRASRFEEDGDRAHSFVAGLEYGLSEGKFVPYLAGRVGGRWATEDAEVCTLTPGILPVGIYQSAGGDPHPDPAVSCSLAEVDTSAFLYQYALGIDWLPPNTRFGATAEAAFTDATAGESGVEFLVGFSFRP